MGVHAECGQALAGDEAPDFEQVVVQLALDPAEGNERGPVAGGLENTA